MSENIGLLLKLILDKVSKAETQKGFNEVADAVDNTGKSVAELTAKEKELTAAIDAQQKRIESAKGAIALYTANLEKSQKRLAADPSKGYLQKNIDSASKSVENHTNKLAEEEKQLASLRGELEATKVLRLDTIDAVNKEKRELNELAKFTGLSVGEFKKLSQEEQATARAALAAQKNIDKLNDELQKTKTRIAELKNFGQSLTNISRGMMLAGTAIVGGLFKIGNDEAQRQKELAASVNEQKDKAREMLAELEKAGGKIDEETRKWIESRSEVSDTTSKWLDSQERIKKSYERIGVVAETTILPLLEKAAEISEKVADAVEKNPELLKAAMNVGGALAVVGAVGMAVGQGIVFAANLKSAALFLQKATMGGNLIKGLLSAGGAASKASTAGTLLTGGTLANIGKAIAAGLSAPAFLATLAASLGVALGVGTYNKYAKATGQDSAGEIAGKTGALALFEINKGLRELGINADKTDAELWDAAKASAGLSDAVKEVGDESGKAAESLDTEADAAKKAREATDKLAAELEGMEILQQLERENVQAERELGLDREKILRDSAQAMSDANNDLRRETQKIKDTLADTLSKLSEDFARENSKALADYKNEYANIVRDGNEEVLQIQRDAKEELRQLEEDYALQVDDLTRSRDALGLVKAEREHERQKEEIERGKDQEIAESRRQTKQRLQDLKQSFEQERAERLAKYQQDVADAKAKAAQEIVDAKIANDLRVAEIAKQKALELAELQRAYTEERRQRILAAYDQIRDAGEGLNAERVMRQRYYEAILADANSYMNSYSAVMTPSGIPSRQAGGYVGSGLYKLHNREFVLSPGTTAAAESLIGSQLSQQALLSSMAGAARSSFSINDARRFDSSIPAAERRAIADESATTALNIFSSLVGARR
jgi:DNA repair exonuclease SbcCD ATPase subunit